MAAEERYGSREACLQAQAMIDISFEHLNGLRTTCLADNYITQKEIRTLETKLVRLFARQLIARQQLEHSGEPLDSLEPLEYPKLHMWLRVVGLSEPSIAGVSRLVGGSFDQLLERSDDQIKDVLCDQTEERLRLLTALHNLKKCTDRHLSGAAQTVDDEDLSWEYLTWPDGLANESRLGTTIGTSISGHAGPPDAASSERATAGGGGTTTNTGAAGCVTGASVGNPGLINSGAGPGSHHVGQATPPESPLVNHFGQSGGASNTAPSVGVSGLSNNTCAGTYVNANSTTTTSPVSSAEKLTPTASSAGGSSVSSSSSSVAASQHNDVLASVQGLERDADKQTFKCATNGENGKGMNCQTVVTWTHLVSVLGATTRPVVNLCSVDWISAASVPSLAVPRSPRLPGMGHAIHHRFTSTVKVTTCQQCDKPMFFGYKCRECKFRCHRDCVDKVPPSCGLPNELVDVFAQRYNQGAGSEQASSSPLPGHSPSLPRHGLPRHGLTGGIGSYFGSTYGQQAGDSSSNTSSCNSSAPNSPQVLAGGVGIGGAGGKQVFRFPPDELVTAAGSRDGSVPPGGGQGHAGKANSLRSTDSDRTVVSAASNSGSISTDSEKTLSVRIGSQDSQVSLDVAEQDAAGKPWPRQNSLSLREWDIPLDEVQLQEKLGEGHFGVVYRGSWHGAVAVKMLNMEQVSQSASRQSEIMDTFKQEVATFRKTRHENLVLFMGACMKPPQLAIVTSLCKGMTLYRHLHLRKDKFNLNRISQIALQICHGMGYLHARGILHKDLKTKNIFYENGKVVITDFGLFSVVKLCQGGQGGRRGDWLTIPQGWLCYLAPELIRDLRPGAGQPDLSFSTRSDVYAFGTVFYELLCGDWPFRSQPPEAIIWQVAKGVKPPLANLQTSQDVKDILMSCWSFQADDRQDFARLQVLLVRLPKKRLARCPSHPVHLSRSAESVF
ncbi:kinase suppressor of Ras 1-like [Tropilaelaps mercedesae]|uniref:Kinase suppressor of Ras 1-like n=1 Tax=Tropilaelaps mercedesae TaxID=418985 RepID=A0A1V9X3X3_9ACAR|nr:kinase suppressor of Ras 1-like [Tropilaelaps mercedesae]